MLQTAIYHTTRITWVTHMDGLLSVSPLLALSQGEGAISGFCQRPLSDVVTLGSNMGLERLMHATFQNLARMCLKPPHHDNCFGQKTHKVADYPTNMKQSEMATGFVVQLLQLKLKDTEYLICS